MLGTANEEKLCLIEFYCNMLSSCQMAQSVICTSSHEYNHVFFLSDHDRTSVEAMNAYIEEVLAKGTTNIGAPPRYTAMSTSTSDDDDDDEENGRPPRAGVDIQSYE